MDFDRVGCGPRWPAFRLHRLPACARACPQAVAGGPQYPAAAHARRLLLHRRTVGAGLSWISVRLLAIFIPGLAGAVRRTGIRRHVLQRQRHGFDAAYKILVDGRVDLARTPFEIEGHFFQLEFDQEQNLKLADFRGGKKLLIARRLYARVVHQRSRPQEDLKSGRGRSGNAFIINRLRDISAATPCGIFTTDGGKRMPIGDFVLTLLPIPVDFRPQLGASPAAVRLGNSGFWGAPKDDVFQGAGGRIGLHENEGQTNEEGSSRNYRVGRGRLGVRQCCVRGRRCQALHRRPLHGRRRR